MEKFSYGLEFYKNNIYKLEDTNLFKRKVKEAEKIEKVLFNTIPNIELVRKFVLRSYYFNKKITFKNRIDFIKGLILADNVISYADVFEFSDHLENQVSVYPNETDWKNLGYVIDMTNPELLNEENTFKLIETFSSDEFNIDDFYDYYQDSESETSDEIITEKEENDDEEIYKDTISFDELDSNRISVSSKQKLDLFIQNKNNIINEIIKRKNILPENQKMVREGMNKWLDYVLTAMNDLYNIRVTTLTYKSKNASDYL